MENVTANIQSLTGNLALDTIVSGLITLVVCYIAIRIIKAVVAKALGKAAKLDLPVKNLSSTPWPSSSSQAPSASTRPLSWPC